MNGEPAGAHPPGSAFEEALRLPRPASLFAAREARLRALASGNAAEDFLLLLARVAAGQRAGVLGARVRAERSDRGPPLAGARVRLDPGWRGMLRAVVSEARDAAPPAEAVAALARLAAASATELDGLAAAVLGGEIAPGDLACVPFVGAGLQAWFAAAASALGELADGDGGPACPACGSPPLAGLVEGVSRRRFLHCALCATAWHVPRARCAGCRDDGGLAYLHAEDAPGVKAEACDRCRSYLKILDEEHRPGAEPAADDAATLALDLVVAEQGFRPLGANLYLGAGLGGRA